MSTAWGHNSVEKVCSSTAEQKRLVAFMHEYTILSTRTVSARIIIESEILFIAYKTVLQISTAKYVLTCELNSQKKYAKAVE